MFIIVAGLMAIGALTTTAVVTEPKKQAAREQQRIEMVERQEQAVEARRERVRQIAQEIVATRKQDEEQTKYDNQYKGREQILTRKEYCEKVKYGQEMCWKVERTK